MRFWKRIDSNGKITTVESYSHDEEILGAIEIGKGEFDGYIAGLPLLIPGPVRDLAKELDGLKATLRSQGIIG